MKAKLERLSLATLAVIDEGRIGVALDQALRRIVDDCVDRPGVGTERVVALTLRIAPEATEAGDLATCDVAFEITEKVPPRKTRSYEMHASENGGLFFSKHSPEDVDQASLEFAPRDDSEDDDEDEGKASHAG